MASDETGAQWKMALHLLFRMDEGQLFPDDPRRKLQEAAAATTDQAFVSLWPNEDMKMSKMALNRTKKRVPHVAMASVQFAVHA